MASRIVFFLMLLLTTSAYAQTRRVIAIDPSFLWGGALYFEYKQSLSDQLMIGGGVHNYEDAAIISDLDVQYNSVFVEADYWLDKVLSQGWSFQAQLVNYSATVEYEFSGGSTEKEDLSGMALLGGLRYNWTVGSSLIFSLGYMLQVAGPSTEVEFENGSDKVKDTNPLPLGGLNVGILFAF
jgi:hypothetical protein